MGITNNDILKKIRVANKLRDEDIVTICSLVDFRISKSELGAFFRHEDHEKYVECGDQVLRNFLNGLIIHLRGPMPKKEGGSERSDRPRRPNTRSDDRPSRPSTRSDDRPSRPSYRADDRPSRPSTRTDDRPSRPSTRTDDRPFRPSYRSDDRAKRSFDKTDDKPSRPKRPRIEK